MVVWGLDLPSNCLASSGSAMRENPLRTDDIRRRKDGFDIQRGCHQRERLHPPKFCRAYTSSSSSLDHAWCVSLRAEVAFSFVG
jgi:hypothetical protein